MEWMRRMKRPFVWTAVLACLTAGSLLLLNLNAEPLEGDARFDGDAIFLPVVIAGNAQYQMELRREHADSPEFRVVQSVRIPDTTTGQAAVLKNNILRIPLIKMGEADYRLEMRMVDGDPQRFTLSMAKAVNEPQQGYAVLPDGRGGFNYEQVFIGEETGFDKARSLAAFEQTLYPYLRSNVCVGCHNSSNLKGSSASLLIAAAEWAAGNPAKGPVVFSAFGAGFHWGALVAEPA